MPRTVSGTWQPHTVKPEKPTSALIAIPCAVDSGESALMLPTIYDYEVKRDKWIDTVSEEPLEHDVFMWLAEEEIAPDDLFQKVKS